MGPRGGRRRVGKIAWGRTPPYWKFKQGSFFCKLGVSHPYFEIPDLFLCRTSFLIVGEQLKDSQNLNNVHVETTRVF